MTRRRMISPAIWDDPEVGELDPLGFKLFIGCISLADDDGRLDADPRTLRKTIFGYTEGTSVEDVRQVRDSMAASLPNVQLYQVDGREYIALLKWNDHQAISASWHQVSIIPPPPAAADVAHDDHLPTTCPSHDDHLPTNESIKQVVSKASENQSINQHTPQKRESPNAKNPTPPTPANPAGPAPVRDASSRPKSISLGTGDPQTDAVNAAADVSKVRARDLVAREVYRVMTPDLDYPEGLTKRAKEARRPFELAAEKVLERIGRENYQQALDACYLLLTEPTKDEDAWLAKVSNPHGLMDTIAKRVNQLRKGARQRTDAEERNRRVMEHQAIPPPAERPVAAEGVPAEYADIWRKALEDMELQLGRPDTCLRDAVLQEVTEGVWTIELNGQFSMGWAQSRLKPSIEHTLALVAGRSVEVVFVGKGDRNGNQDED